MKKFLFIIWLILFSLTFIAQAEYKVYTNVEDFEKDKWDICEAATDGCNSYILQDWKVTGGTKKYCENHIPEWTCTKYKEGTITTLSIPVTTTENTESPICTMEYAPVCAKVQVQCIKAPCGSMLETFSNSCMAGDNEIIFTWSCNTKLSDNDISFYNSIKTSKLDSKIQDKVYNFIDNYKKILFKYNSTLQKKINNKVLILVDEYISDILLNYPQDSSLPESVNNKYLMLKLLKYEIQLLN